MGEGECWLSLAGGREPIRLSEGDVILVASGVGHTLSDPSDAPVLSIGTVLSTKLSEKDQPRRNDVTTLLCAKYSLDGTSPHPMISLLPPLIQLTSKQIDANEPLRLAMELLRVEASDDLIGYDIVAPRLLDSVLVFLLWVWIENQVPGTVGWFARRFARLVGEPPLAYVTRWRMNLAARTLRETSRTIDEIERAVGYESAPSFSQAFARLIGRAPGRYRSSFRVLAPRLSDAEQT